MDKGLITFLLTIPGIALAVAGGVAIVIVFLIINRIKKKKEENFEQRSN